jgi:hypothetical protein
VALYNSTTGNPHSAVNYARVLQSADGPQEFVSKGLSFFVQDTLPVGNRLTLNLGVRTERWEHFATTGENIITFDWAWSPRLSATYDLGGDGRQKLSGFWGRYYDPVRTNMTAFAGSLTGRAREEQLYVANGINQWITYRVRGGAILDGFFAPTIKTPYTEDLQLGYSVDLGRNMSLSRSTTTAAPGTSWKTTTRRSTRRRRAGRPIIRDRSTIPIRCSWVWTTSDSR